MASPASRSAVRGPTRTPEELREHLPRMVEDFANSKIRLAPVHVRQWYQAGIEVPKPDYDGGGSDGCVMGSEFRMSAKAGLVGS